MQEPGPDMMVLRASFLVDRVRLGDFDRAVDRLRDETDGRLRLACVGPFPRTRSSASGCRTAGGVMGLFRLLTLPVSGPVLATRRLLEVLLEEAERDLYDEGSIRGQLADLRARHELGEIDGPELERQEELLLERLLDDRAYHRQKQAGAAGDGVA